MQSQLSALQQSATMTTPTLDQATAITWVFVGIIVSLVLPIAVRTLRVNSGLEGPGEHLSTLQRARRAWRQYGGNKYLAVVIAAAVVATTLVFLLGVGFYTIRDAVLAGFAWESFINKLIAQRPPALVQVDTPPAQAGAGT